jgi:hypothetical protein
MNIKNCLIIFLFAALFFGQIPIALGQTAKNTSSFENLTKGKKISGFRADAVYLSDADSPMAGVSFTSARVLLLICCKSNPFRKLFSGLIRSRFPTRASRTRRNIFLLRKATKGATSMRAKE